MLPLIHVNVGRTYSGTCLCSRLWNVVWYYKDFLATREYCSRETSDTNETQTALEALQGRHCLPLEF